MTTLKTKHSLVLRAMSKPNDTTTAITNSPILKTLPSSLPIMHGRVAVVTGSSRGIGRAIALHLGKLGAKVVVNCICNTDQAHIVADEINCNSYSSSGETQQAIVVKADVSDPIQVKFLFDEAERVFGSEVHVLVNSAAIIDSNYPTIADTTVENFDRIFSVNCRGTFVLCKEAANRIKRGGGGRIILLSSSRVRAMEPNIAPYTAAKAAVETMAKILAKELKGTGITANCVAPGTIATDLLLTGISEKRLKTAIEECPYGRLGLPADVAPLVGFLASDASEWVNGQVIGVNGGIF